MNETNSNDKPIVRGYKIIGPDWKCRDKQYYCPGEFEEDVKPKIGSRGMHFCLKLSDCFLYYSEEEENNHYVEIETYGNVEIETYEKVEFETTLEKLEHYKSFSEASQCCTNKLRIIKELTIEEVVNILKEENKEESNFGFKNRGVFNYGYCNMGYRNDGKMNRGIWNNGEENIGDGNDGIRNIGKCGNRLKVEFE